MNYKTKIPTQIQKYIDMVENEEIETCIEQKELVKYVKNVFLNENLKYNIEQIEKYLSYQKYFPFDLYEWEIFCFILHNCIFRTDGLPRWSDLFILIGRGAGKNGFLSFEDFCLITETNGIANYNIDISATSEEQARTSFDEIYNILENNTKYKKVFERNFYWSQTVIRNKKTNSEIKYRTNNPKGKDGLRSGKVDLDEVHAYVNWENINVFTTALGKKPHPRKTYISSQGDVREGPLDNLINKSLMIFSGEIPDNGFLPFICKLDNEEEVHDEKMWEKANPSLRYNLHLLEEIRKEYFDYKLEPIIHSDFMTKRMNLPQGKKDTEVATWDDILKTNRGVPDLTGYSCVCGIDYMKTTDFMSAFLLFKVKDLYYGITHSWFCLKSNDRYRIKVPIKQFEAQGILTIVDDVEIHPHHLTDWINEQSKKYHIEKLAIDSYRYTLLSSELKKIGFDANDKEKVKLVRPSDLMMIVPSVNSLFVNGKVIWGDNPLMRWFTNNTKLEPAPNNNLKYGKIEPKSRKTDGFMAFVAAMTIEDCIKEKTEIICLDVLIF